MPNLTARENVLVATEISQNPMDVDEALELVGPEGADGPFSLAALRRRAAARGDRPGLGQESGAAVVRRADRRARLRDRQARAAAAGRSEAAAGQDDSGHHAQRGHRAGGRPRDPACARARFTNCTTIPRRSRRRRSRGERARSQAAARSAQLAAPCCWPSPASSPWA